MELINRTPVAARLLLGGPIDGFRMGLLVAKATYRIGDDGTVAMETEQPVPILQTDVETPFGQLPRDDMPHPLDCFEVLLLGAAQSARPVTDLVVELSVGSVKRALRVTGDRKRAGAGSTPPAPFTQMPLTWSRAYGGTARVWIDRDAAMDVPCSWNPHGRGFDPRRDAEALGKLFACPQGYPILEGSDELPNLEPAEGAFPGNETGPACWAPLPATSPISAKRSFPGAVLDKKPADVSPTMFLRAHPDWVIDLPERQAQVELKNASWRQRLAFRLPTLRTIVDFAAPGVQRRRELVPMMLVLLPELRQFYIVFKRSFRLPADTSVGGAFRLRVADGWRGRES